MVGVDGAATGTGFTVLSFTSGTSAAFAGVETSVLAAADGVALSAVVLAAAAVVFSSDSEAGCDCVRSLDVVQLTTKTTGSKITKPIFNISRHVVFIFLSASIGCWSQPLQLQPEFQLLAKLYLLPE